MQAGFQEARPLSGNELTALPLLVAARLSLSLTKGAAGALADPGNADYLLKTQRHGWSVLDALHGRDLLACLGLLSAESDRTMQPVRPAAIA